MLTKNFIRKDSYYDSVYLMRLGRRAGETQGVERLSVGMGTPLNKDTLRDLELLTAEGEAARANDLIVAVSAQNEAAARAAYEALCALLVEKAESRAKAPEPRSIAEALERRPGTNLAVISLQADYAPAQAEEALRRGLHVFLFTDNVPMETEARLKRLAEERGLLLMGPGCGLSFLDGVALGLCSKVRRGPVGLIGASGSGIQEIMCLLHRGGVGSSQAIGTGAHDLNDQVGAVTMLRAMRLLEADADTRAIVLVSKPPQPEAMRKVAEAIRGCEKPVIVRFLGTRRGPIEEAGGRYAATFEEAARLAAQAVGASLAPEEPLPDARALAAAMRPEQRKLIGLYCGGALCGETAEILGEDPDVTLLDVGDERFTRGRPHVAIDPSARVPLFERAARDPGTAVILLDFLLGYGLHEDPAGMMAQAIRAERARAADKGRSLAVIASVTGTDLDPQGDAGQREKLARAGCVLAGHNGQAARLAAEILAVRRETR